MDKLEIKMEWRAAYWVVAYLLAIILLPAFLAWFFAGLEAGYEGSGQLAPAFRPLVFVITPLFIIVIVAVQFVVAVFAKQLRPGWLIAIPAVALFALIANPVQRRWCAASHVCWVGRS